MNIFKILHIKLTGVHLGTSTTPYGKSEMYLYKGKNVRISVMEVG